MAKEVKFEPTVRETCIMVFKTVLFNYSSILPFSLLYDNDKRYKPLFFRDLISFGLYSTLNKRTAQALCRAFIKMTEVNQSN